MSMRPKTKRRLIILITALIVISGTVVGLVLLQQHRNEQALLERRRVGMEAYQRGDYAEALYPLSGYLVKRPKDLDARFAFAKSRSEVEDPKVDYLGEAIAHLLVYLQDRPDDAAARHLLLDLYYKSGRNAEAIDLATQLLAKDPADIEALRNRAKCQYRLRKFQEALADSEKLNELAPLDLEGHQLTYELLFQLKRPVSEVLKRAEDARAKHPDDARFELLQAFAYLYAGNTAEATQWLDTASKHPMPSPEFVRLLVRLYDSMRLFDRGQKVLEQIVSEHGDPKLLQMLIDRLWQASRFTEVVDRLANLDLKSDKTDTHLLAIKAYSLYQLNRGADAKPVVDALASRKNDDAARAWAITLRARYEDPTLDTPQRIEQYDKAVLSDPSNAVIRFMIGEAYARIRETELALDAWRRSSELDPGWAAPRAQRARLLAMTGRIDAAIDEASEAIRRSPTVGSVIAGVVALYYKSEQTGNPADMKEALKLATTLQTQVPYEPETLGIYVTLLAKSGQRDQAIEIVRGALESQRPLSQDALLSLAEISRTYKMGLERRIYDIAEQKFGITPSLAYSRASDLNTAGESQRGLEYLQSVIQNQSGDPVQWKLALAQYLELIRDPKARDSWIALGDAYPKNLTVQTAVLASTSAHADREFIKRTIERYKALTGAEGYSWKLAQARWLMGSGNDKDNAAAIVLLVELTRASPNLLEPHLLLAKAMEESGHADVAVEQLTQAVGLKPGSIDILIDLVRLLQRQTRFDEARKYLDRAAASPSLSPDARRRIAMMYAQQGNLDQAVTLLQGVPASDNDPARLLILAQVQRQRGDFDAADKIFAQLLKASEVDAATIDAAADFYASRGDMDQARQILARLDGLKLSPGRAELIRAEFNARYVGNEAAVGQYQAAIKAAPADANIRIRLISYYIRQEDFAHAVSSADEALKAIPGNRDIQNLRDRASALASNKEGGNYRDLIDVLSHEPNNEAAIQTLKILNDSTAKSQQVVTQAKESNEPAAQTNEKLRQIVEQEANALRPLADRFPRFFPLQAQLIGDYLKLRKLNDAMQVAQRTMDALPTSPDAARLAVQVFAAAGRPTDVLVAARNWRQRSMQDPRGADIAIAEAQLALNNVPAAMDQLKPYEQLAKSNPKENLQLVSVYARALIMSDRTAEAAAIILPLAKNSAQWRELWLTLIPLAPRGASGDEQRIQQVIPFLPADSFDEQLGLARAWYDLGQRYGQQTALERARDLLKKLSANPQARGDFYILLGSTYESLGDLPSAESAYRTALDKEPTHAVAMNQLAYTLLQMGKNLPEALQWSQKAVALNPSVATLHDTLARIYAQLQQWDNATTSFRNALKLDPNNIESLIGLADALTHTNNKDEARAIVQQVDNLLRAAPPLSVPLSQQLQNVRRALATAS
ncbi:MAG: tetratricopeptide repeat protein [Phycisphaerales bacterium]|jgi:tetratricopeptide (TPR) repeat protein|nr:tetratricopeptide repeat protein [Phycisphaerales bacterium]